MITEFYGSFGCYLEENAVKIVVTHPSDMPMGIIEDRLMSYLYEEAKQCTLSWVGSRGFCEYEDEEFDSEEDQSMQEDQDVEDACDYELHPWDEKWEGEFVGSVDGNTVTMEIN